MFFLFSFNYWLFNRYIGANHSSTEIAMFLTIEDKKTNCITPKHVI